MRILLSIALLCAICGASEKSLKVVRDELTAWSLKNPAVHVIVQVSAKPTSWCFPPNPPHTYQIVMHDDGEEMNRKRIRHELKHVEQMERGENPNTPDNEWAAHKAEEGGSDDDGRGPDRQASAELRPQGGKSSSSSARR